MTPQATRIFDYLSKWGSDTDSNIGKALDIPAPSVRRSLQELIHEGIDVSYAGNFGLYTITKR